MTATLPFRHGDHVVAYTRYSGGEEQGLKDRSTKEQKDTIKKLCEENRLILRRRRDIWNVDRWTGRLPPDDQRAPQT